MTTKVLPITPPASTATDVPLRALSTNGNVRATATPETEPAQRALAESIAAHGVLVPLLVVADGPDTYTVVDGHRRLTAARALALTHVPVRVLRASPTEASEIALVANLQRQDLSPLDEAEGYRALMLAGQSVDRVAARVGRPVRYVSDRLALLGLIGEARTLLTDGTLTLGHALLLARLSPDVQKALVGRKGHRGDTPLFQRETVLYDPDAPGAVPESVRAISVRELAAWIDQHVKLTPTAADPDLFPETARVVTAATERAERIVPITHEHFIQPEARDGQRVYGPRSWTRADGSKGHPTCARAVTGVFVVGFARGQTVRVCIEKKTCKTHWAREQKAAKARQTEARASGRSAEDRYAKQRADEEAAHKLEDAKRARWDKARPALLQALATHVRTLPAGIGTPLSMILLDATRGHRGLPASLAETLAPGEGPADVVRLAAFHGLVDQTHRWDAMERFPAVAKRLGFDVMKHVPLLPEETKATTDQATARATTTPTKSTKKTKTTAKK
jgi:ParB/RepB/Spo0J family partition protein